MRIIFFGTPGIAAGVLEILAQKFEVVLAVTQPDKPVGRKQEMQQSAVALSAAGLGISVIKPATLKDSHIAGELQDLAPDLFVVVAYGKIIPKNILAIPKLGAVNIHGSILPKYRGASPIHAALLNGDAETGITVMLMDEQMDHGPILATHEVEVGRSEKFTGLAQKIAELAQKHIVQDLEDFASGKLKPVPQDHASATYTKILSKADGQIDWKKSAAQIYNQFRAYSIWPGIWTKFNGSFLKITDCAPANIASIKPGQVVLENGKIIVGTGQGGLELYSVQLEGKNETKAADFVRGHNDFISAVLE